MAAALQMPHDSYAALRVPNFRRLILGYGTTTIAREAQIVVVGWQVYEHTRDPLSLGMIGLAEALPFIAVALYAGHVADRLSRRADRDRRHVRHVAVGDRAAAVHDQRDDRARTRLADLPRDLSQRHRAQLHAAGVHRAVGRGDLARHLRERRGVAQLDVAVRGGLGPALGGLLYGFAGAAVAYAAVIASMCTLRSPP